MYGRCSGFHLFNNDFSFVFSILQKINHSLSFNKYLEILLLGFEKVLENHETNERSH